MTRIFLVLISAFFFISSGAFAADTTSTQNQVRYLHISTNPSFADVYVNNTRPDYADKPDYTLPGFIPVPAGENSILLTLFRPEFADTSINVTLSQKDTSYLIVALRPVYNEQISKEQYSELSHRNRRSIGHNLLLASIVPFVASGISALVSWYNIEQANDKKDDIDETLFRESEQYQSDYDKFADYRDNARQAKNLAKIGLICGGIVFAAGLVLSF